jgi:hypothetical protein
MFLFLDFCEEEAQAALVKTFFFSSLHLVPGFAWQAGFERNPGQ